MTLQKIDNINAIDHRFIVDIETAPLPDAASFADTNLRPPKNYKKAETIEAWKQDARAKALDRAALDPDLCRVVAIGVWPEGGSVEAEVARTPEEEHIMISKLWALLRRGHIVGYNVIGFDLPVLLRRSLYLSVEHPPAFRLNKYRPSNNITDLMLQISFDGAMPYRSLRWYARRFGLATSADAIDGRDVPMLATLGQWDAVKAHVEDDVRLTGELASRIERGDILWGRQLVPQELNTPAPFAASNETVF